MRGWKCILPSQISDFKFQEKLGKSLKDDSWTSKEVSKDWHRCFDLQRESAAGWEKVTDIGRTMTTFYFSQLLVPAIDSWLWL